MILFKRVKIRSYEVGLYFRDGEFNGLLSAGRHWLFDPLWKVQVDVVSQRAPWLVHDKLDVIVKSGALAGRAEVVDLKDYERALVWIDGRFSHILPPGLYAYWTGVKDVRVEVVDARKVRLQHDDFKPIVRSLHAAQVLDICTVDRNHVGVSFQDGEYVEMLPPGEYAFWRNVAASKVVEVDLREQTLDIAGQDIMTADRVTLRITLRSHTASSTRGRP
jgi:regulator of protease activity HflC (stomatin/prohibitin superfamily)